MKLHVGNLSKDITDAQLLEIVTPFGTPQTTEVAKDRQNGQSKGFGFVTFADADQAKAAIAGLDGKEFNGQTIKVSEARAPKDREVRATS
jgi:RNA recognition motif-containing protein